MIDYDNQDSPYHPTLKIDSHTDHIQQAKIEVSNGDVDVDKTLFAGNITMTNSNGGTSVHLNQDPSQMSFYLETKMGDIDVV